MRNSWQPKPGVHISCYILSMLNKVQRHQIIQIDLKTIALNTKYAKTLMWANAPVARVSTPLWHSWDACVQH